MKKLLSLLVILSLGSCITLYYQISEVNADPAKMKSNNIYEDSTFKITYNFWSNGGILKFDLYNKLNVPVYVDWDRSNFILNDHSVSYSEQSVSFEKPEAVPMLAKITGREYYLSMPYNTKMETQIPPHSYITVNKFNFNVPYYSIGYYPKTKDSTVYTKENSIMHFRNYIGYTTNQDLSNLKFVDNEFWVAKVTTTNNKYFNENKIIPNVFYVSYER